MCPAPADADKRRTFLSIRMLTPKALASGAYLGLWSRWSRGCGRTSRMRAVVIVDEIFRDIETRSRIDDRYSVRIDQQRDAPRLRVRSQRVPDVLLQRIQRRQR